MSKDDEWEDETMDGISEAETGVPAALDSAQVEEKNGLVDEGEMDEIL